MQGYDTAEYAGSRLVETVIRLGETPVLIHNVDTDSVGRIRLKYEDIMTDVVNRETIDKFNLDPVPLGYVNSDGEARYVTRMPLRNDWKQGIRQRSICDIGGYGINHITYRTIGYTIMGKFPKIATVLERVSRGHSSMAFSREFAITSRGVLKYKALFDVGKVNMDNGGVAIDPAFSWVKEHYDEVMENVAA